MTLTGEEARKKWCPFVRMLAVYDSGTSHNGYNRWVKHEGDAALNPDGCRCIGSECMAWRWFDTVSDDGTACHMKPTAHVKRHPDNHPAEAHPLQHRRGYCGLAGTP